MREGEGYVVVVVVVSLIWFDLLIDAPKISITVSNRIKSTTKDASGRRD